MPNPCLNCVEIVDCKNCTKRPKHKCGAVTEVFSRVSGYFRPTSKWNIGKREEFRNRKVFKTSGYSPVNKSFKSPA